MVSSAPDISGSLKSAAPSPEVELVRLRAAHQDLLRACSHDLRAPLRHITAFAPLLREILEPAALSTLEREEALEFLGTMEQAGQRMTRMLEGLLALSRVQAAQLRIETVDLQRLVAPLVETLAANVQGREIEWVVSPQLPEVQADADQLRLLLKELLANAIKFTRASPAARIAISGTRDAAGVCRLSVEDNGAGFDMAQSKGLFGLFQRMHPERAFEGVGAGLALVAAIAARHGGSVGAQAAPAQGCTVTLQWPG